MRKFLGLIVALLIAAALPGAGAACTESEEQAEWTVLFYLCGSDLESKYGFASGNLQEIANCRPPRNEMSSIIRAYGDEIADAENPGKVNVLIETGGCKQWHSEGLDMNISPKGLNRWRYDLGQGDVPGSFTLLEDRASASMADPETLSEFIRWGVETCPAKKYALILWDHGGGSKSGLFIDEIFGGGMMTLTQLNRALREGGTQFEAVLFDACMMANVETAYAVKDHARWMIASEEVVAGQGTAIGSWLQQLYYDPQVDGERLGRWICDMSQIKYGQQYNGRSGELLTWSVIDLTKIDRLANCIGELFHSVGRIYEHYPKLLAMVVSAFHEAEGFGNGQDNMFDLFDVCYNPAFSWGVGVEHRREMLDALTDAVVYAVRGTGRSAARGLSICFPTDFDDEELEIYASNCPQPWYLAFLDAISPTWSAPDWVYKNGATRLKDISDIDDYTIVVRKRVSKNGTPGIFVELGTESVSNIFYRIYRVDEALGQTVRIGIAPAYSEETAEGEEVNCAYEPWLWPHIDGKLCNAELISKQGSDVLGEIPVQIGSDVWKLRFGYTEEYGYELFGLWEGYDADTKVFNRNVKSLAQLTGMDFQLLFPEDDPNGSDGDFYEYGDTLTLHRGMEMEEQPLPPGEYYLEYVVEDIFFRRLALDSVKMTWDGDKMTFSEGERWEGETTLRWNGWED